MLPGHGHPVFRGCCENAGRQWVILSLATQQPASAGKVWIRCQRWPAHCIIKPIISAALLSRRNFDCSCCVGTEGIPRGSVARSCCELKRVAGLHWGSQKDLKMSDFVYVSDKQPFKWNNTSLQVLASSHYLHVMRTVWQGMLFYLPHQNFS